MFKNHDTDDGSDDDDDDDDDDENDVDEKNNNNVTDFWIYQQLQSWVGITLADTIQSKDNNTILQALRLQSKIQLNLH